MACEQLAQAGGGWPCWRALVSWPAAGVVPGPEVVHQRACLMHRSDHGPRCPSGARRFVSAASSQLALDQELAQGPELWHEILNTMGGELRGSSGTCAGGGACVLVRATQKQLEAPHRFVLVVCVALVVGGATSAGLRTSPAHALPEAPQP